MPRQLLSQNPTASEIQEEQDWAPAVHSTPHSQGYNRLGEGQGQPRADNGQGPQASKCLDKWNS